MRSVLLVAFLAACRTSAAPPEPTPFVDLDPDCGHDGQLCCPDDLGYDCVPDFACGGGYCRGRHEP